MQADGTTGVSIEKCSSPTGDGNKAFLISEIISLPIEKCSSPTGDGNLGHCVMFSYGLLPN